MTLVDRRTYRGKSPRRTTSGHVNDRTIVRIDTERQEIHYRSMTDGSRLHPKIVAREWFEIWASFDVTEQLPAGEYMTWEQYLNQQVKNQQNETLQLAGR